MCCSSSGQVMTPGVSSGFTYSGQTLHIPPGASTSLHISVHTPANLFCTCIRLLRSALMHDDSEETTFCARAGCRSSSRADACFRQAFNVSWPQATKLSMCCNSSGQVMTPGVSSGFTKLGQVLHIPAGASTSLHMSVHTPASLFCTCIRLLKSALMHDCSEDTTFCA